jgi:iron complex transport system substrate-binding protein
MNKSWKIALALLIALGASVSTLGAGADFTLGIFGNANMDDTIDEKDIAYVEGVIKGTNEATNLSDANYDGKIDAQDIEQINEILNESEKELILIDSAGRIVALKMPVERIIPLSSNAPEAIGLLSASDKIVGITQDVKDRNYDFPDLQDRQVIGKGSDPNYEMIGKVAQKGGTIPQDIIVIAFSYKDYPYGAFGVDENLAPLKNISVIALDFYKQETLNEEVTQLGFILKNVEAAKKFIDWHDQQLSKIDEAIRDLPVPKVYLESNSKGGLGALSTYGNGSGTDQLLKAAKGYNIIRENVMYPKIDWEQVVSLDPDVIIKTDYLKSSDTKPGWTSAPSADAVTLEAIRNDILSRPGANNISAVKSGRVYILRAEILYGLSNLFGLSYMAKLIHPEASLNPEGANKEYRTMSGLADYSDDREFVYPNNAGIE